MFYFRTKEEVDPKSCVRINPFRTPLSVTQLAAAGGASLKISSPLHGCMQHHLLLQLRLVCWLLTIDLDLVEGHDSVCQINNTA